MISKFLLIASSASALKGLLQFRREKYFYKMFQDVEKMPIYNLSYLNSLDDLPKNKHVLLAGKIQTQTLYMKQEFIPQRPLYSDQKQNALFSIYLPTLPKKMKNIGEGMDIPIGRMFHFKRVQLLKFELVGGEHKVKVEPPLKNDIVVFDIPSFREDIKASEIKGDLKFGGGRTYTEYALLPNQDVVICAELKSNADRIRPILILGSSKEAFLDSLDDKLVELSRSGKMWFAGSFGIVVIIKRVEIIMIILLIISQISGSIIEDQSVRLRQSCQSGKTGYYWDGQQCLQCKSLNCICNQYLGCYACQDHYYFDQVKQDCHRCPYGCVDCCRQIALTQIVCSKCADGFILKSGVCIKIEGCQEFSNDVRCVHCQNGYYLDSTCKSCSDHCDVCFSDTDCRQCSSGYYLEIELHQGICKECSIVGCSDCQNNECTSCKDGYYKTSGSCGVCPDNCQLCKDSSTCVQCFESYLLYPTGQCKSCQQEIENCLDCIVSESGTYQCKDCLNGYYSEDGNCLDCRSKDQNVRRCESLEIITQCMPGYLLLPIRYLKYGIPNLLKYQCVENVYNCQSTTLNPLTNAIDGTCDTCLPGYDFKLFDDTIQGCEQCNNTIQYCTDCTYNTTSLTQVCIVCEDFYYPNASGDECVPCTANCQDCSSEFCYTCEIGYYLDEKANKCYSCGVEKCEVCKTSGICEYCADEYGFIDGECLPCQNGCKTCDYDQKTCSECMDNYYLYVRSCIPYQEKCLKANEVGFCYLCDTEIAYDTTYSQFTADEGEERTPFIESASYFYKSVNGYCLLCSDYEADSFFCPNECPVLNLYGVMILSYYIFLY